MSLIIFCLVVAVVWLFIRTGTLSDTNAALTTRLDALSRRLQELQDAPKQDTPVAGIIAPPQSPLTPAFSPPPPTGIVQPPPARVAGLVLAAASVAPPPVPPPLPDFVQLAPTPVFLTPLESSPMLSTPLVELPPLPGVLVPVARVAQLSPAPVPVAMPAPPSIPVVPNPLLPLAGPVIPAVVPAADAQRKLELPASAPAKTAPPSPPQSFEIRLGSYWFVRAGVVLLLTGFVFLANLAYREWVTQLGAAGKVVLLYLASGGLLGAGAWLQRKSAPETLRNFAHVLLAGGLGAVYFTTYAAHHYEALRVIDSAAFDGALLLAWAGFIVWLADRKKSETLALFALGLGFYTAVVTRVGTFTLFSNLVLTIATVFFLVRNRWAKLTLASLVASYGGFAFWRFFHDGQWLLRAPVDDLVLPAVFLAGYWVCFTAATFLAQSDLLADKRRSAFLSANNGAFFALVTLSMAAAQGWQLWQFCVGFGAVLLGLAAFARTRLPAEPSVRAAYVTQGLLLVTLGLITKFSGQQLAVLLAAESVVLLTLGCRQPSRLLRAGAFVSAALAVGWQLVGAGAGQSPALGLGVAGLLLFNAWWMSRHEDPADTALLRPRTTWLSLLALVAGCATILQHAPQAHIAVWLMGAGLLLTLSVHILRTREIALFAQGYLFLAHASWLSGSSRPAELLAWKPILLLAGTLTILCWWTRQTVVGERKPRTTFEMLYALALIALLHTWLRGHFPEEQWLLATSVLALAVTATGAFLRVWRLAAAGQWFTLVAAIGFIGHVRAPHPEWAFALAPMAMLLLLAGATRWACARHPELADEARKILHTMATAYRWVVLAMVVAMVVNYVPVAHRPWTFAVLGGALFAIAGWQRASQPLLGSGLLLGLGLLALIAPRAPIGAIFFVPNLLAVLLPLALQQVARRAPGRFPVPANLHIVVLLFAGGFLWLHLTRWLGPERNGQLFTLVWSVLGPVFFVAGVALRERTYFVLGLACLVAALFRVVTHDAWQAELFVLNLLPMFAVLALQRVARRHPDGAALPDTAHAAAILVSGLSLWLFISRWVVQASGGKFFLTASWAALALIVFATSFALRERVYRWLGLVVLAGALGRVMLLDVWQLALVYRVLSFMALGIVLIVLGYVYNRWQDKIREWL